MLCSSRCCSHSSRRYAANSALKAALQPPFFLCISNYHKYGLICKQAMLPCLAAPHSISGGLQACHHADSCRAFLTGNRWEAAVYGAMCGHVTRMLPVCNSWEDEVWAYCRWVCFATPSYSLVDVWCCHNISRQQLASPRIPHLINFVSTPCTAVALKAGISLQQCAVWFTQPVDLPEDCVVCCATRSWLDLQTDAELLEAVEAGDPAAVTFLMGNQEDDSLVSRGELLTFCRHPVSLQDCHAPQWVTSC